MQKTSSLPNAPTLLAPGVRFGKYEIVRLIGAGGMGAVYEANHLELRRRVAIKMLLPEIASIEEARKRFLREGEAAARIQHPNVIAVMDVDSEGQMPYLVMEFLHGEPLDAFIERQGALSLESALDVMLPVMAAVQAGHDAGVIHRDIKPPNIFLEKTNRGGVNPKVLDFGVSKLISEKRTTELTGQTAVLGTAAYMSPEQACGSASVTPASDEYSLCLVLLELLTGQVVHAGSNQLAVLASVIQNRLPNLDEALPNTPLSFRAILRRGLEFEPLSRFGSVKLLAAALLPFAGQRTQIVWGETFALESHEPALAPTPLPNETPRTPSELARTRMLPSESNASVPDSRSKTTDRISQRPRRPQILIIASAIVCLVIAVILLMTLRSSDGKPDVAPNALSVPQAPPPPAQAPPPPAVAPQQMAVDPPPTPAGVAPIDPKPTLPSPAVPRRTVRKTDESSHEKTGVNDAPILR